MSAYIKDAEKQSIIRELSACEASGSMTYVYSSELLTADELLKLGFSVINEVPGLLLIMKHPATHTCLLLSSSEEHKCGQLVKEHAPEHSGRGGGRDDNARAVFASAGDMDGFVKSII